jgi:sec-independent protein translocase protein TatA
MGSFSLVHWLIVLVVVLVLFGRGRISEIMGDFGKGIKSFKHGLNEDVTPPPPAQISPPEAAANPPASPAPATSDTTKTGA